MCYIGNRLRSGKMREKRRQKRRVKNCQWCGNAFTAARYHAKFCSGRCRTRASREGQKKADLGYADVTLSQLELLVKKHVS